MARFVLENELKVAVKESTFIKNGSENCCEGMKYDFRVSSKFVSPRFNKHEIEYDQSNITDFVIKPGETAFVTTEELLELPGDMFCQLSTKRKLSHEGILVLGGFCVDPNYKGKLFFGLHNLSREDYPFRPGNKIIAGVFYKLSPEEASEVNSNPVSLTEFPDDLLNRINTFQSSTPEVLENRISELANSVKLLRDQLDSDKTWRDDFKKGLTESREQIDKISISVDTLNQSLEKEREERIVSESKLSSKLSVVNGIGIVLGALFGGGLVSLIVMYVAGILHFGG